MGTLFVVATPIGNLEDFSSRAARVLREVTLIAAEDTRHSRRLLTHFGIDTPVISYHEHNERERQDRLLCALDLGNVALICDAGTPGVSDPGAALVAAVLASGHTVSPIPGPSALTAAMSVSGLIDGPFLALGFLTRDRAERRVSIARAVASSLPVVLFESPQRVAATLGELKDAFGDRQAAVMRELTKIHEEVRSGMLSTLQEWAASSTPRGEIVIVIAGRTAKPDTATDADEVVNMLRQSGLSASQAAREAASITGLPRSELYRLALDFERMQSIRLEGELALPDEDALQNPLGNQEHPKR